MGVIRVPHHENFTTMANYHLRDERLSLRAVGLMSKMLSLPDSWDYTVAGLARICKEGREAVRKVLQELESAGYLEREQSRSGGGTFAGYDYTLHEAPTGRAAEGVGPCEEAAPLPGNLGDGDAPLPGNPVPGFPPQSKTDYQVLNPPIVPPEGDQPSEKSRRRRTRKVKAAPDWKPERFEAFWRYYPAIPDGNGRGRRPAKDRAIAAWDRLRPDDATIDKIALALKYQKASRQWVDGIGIPYASTWLNARSWEEEYEPMQEPAPAQPTQAAQNGGYELWT